MEKGPEADRRVFGNAEEGRPGSQEEARDAYVRPGAN